MAILTFNEPLIDLDDIAEQAEEVERLGNESRSPYGNLIISVVGTVTTYTLKSTPVTFEVYRNIQGYLKAKMYTPVSVYLDHLGGNITASVRVTATRVIAGRKNNMQILDIEITEA